MHTAIKVAVRGRVQGVGFRPFVYQLAHEHQLAGTVQNNMDGVKIYIEGQQSSVGLFLHALKEKAPRLSKINEVSVEETAPIHAQGFTILESEREGKSMLVIPIDSAVCDDCLQEMNNPANLRYQYPFINCTQCGPRYTIIEELPYDRPYTTMKSFPMCDDCRQEYEDPENRRHHAEPIACPKCGPKVQLLSRNGKEIECENPILQTIELLKQGKIVAIKGIGGYHLSCDASNEQAVAALRLRKNRPLRPLAVMAANLAAVEGVAEAGTMELNLLKSPEAPIVILKKKTGYALADSVAPRIGTIGIMLPYTPLHHLLLADPKLSCLVMTSANPSGLPIVYDESRAISNLAGIADYFLVNNRPILHPVDDSVIQVNDGKLDFLRRSRGFVPDSFTTDRDVSGIIAFGGQQKTTFTIGRNDQIFIGPHIGDLENMETIQHYQRELEHLMKWIDTPQNLAVIDMHPGYQVQSLVKDYDFQEVLEVQHHHAHMAACLGEHHISSQAYGIILDGTGYGTDGNIWGFEILYGDASEVTRVAHLQYSPLPGGEKCIQEPWRNAAAMLMSLLGEEGIELGRAIFPEKEQEITILNRMIRNNVNTVYAGTCGRLFDAVSALCGVTKVSTYDGEAAVRLAELADEKLEYQPYCYDLIESGLITIDFSKMIKEIALDVLNGEDVALISGRFQETVVMAIVSVMEHCCPPEIEKTVVLSGGSIHNRYLRKRLNKELSILGFRVCFQEKVPCNDGGLSYGQLVVAAAKRSAKKCV